MHEYIVYILRCGDDTLYTGVTSDLPLRLYQHENAVFADCYTVKRRPVRLVYTASFEDVHEAIAWEHRVKRWSRRKKEALVAGEWERLPGLACMACDWTIAVLVRGCRFSVMVSLSNHDTTVCRPSTSSG